MGWKRSRNEKQKLKKLYNKVKDTGYPRPVYYDEEEERYIRQYQNKGLKDLANYCNRRVRRFDGEIPDGAAARKIKRNAKWDFW